MYSNIKGQTIYYQKLGKGPNLILLHGWGQDVSTFWPNVEFLKNNFTLWLIDLPGFGRSDYPKIAYDTKDYAKAILEFIKQHKIKNPNLLGHSFGGKVSIKLAYLYPENVKKLILVGSSGIKPAPSYKTLLLYPLVKIIHYIIPDVFNLKTILRKKFYRKIESDYEDAGLMKNTLLKTLKEDLTSDLKKISTQTLLIWGDQDRAVSLKYGKLMYSLIKNSKLVIFDGYGHFLHIHNPERFAYYVRDFI